ncbi:MAG: hypothetical protein RR225_03870 [Clostridium sp.]
MAYFDSLKNQAIWKVELAALRSEKEARHREGYVPKNVPEQVKSNDSVHRKKITFKDLMAMEQEEKGSLHRQGRSRVRENSLTKSAEKDVQTKTYNGLER